LNGDLKKKNTKPKKYLDILRNIMDEYFGTIRGISRCRAMSFTK
jgi:hypothetical protein